MSPTAYKALACTVYLLAVMVVCALLHRGLGDLFPGVRRAPAKRAGGAIVVSIAVVLAYGVARTTPLVWAILMGYG